MTLTLHNQLDNLAGKMGYCDMEQMTYYENLPTDGAMSDSEADALAEREFLLAVQQLPPPPATIFLQPHELESVDCREVYGDDYSMAGVY